MMQKMAFTDRQSSLSCICKGYCYEFIRLCLLYSIQYLIVAANCCRCEGKKKRNDVDLSIVVFGLVFSLISTKVSEGSSVHRINWF